MHCELNTNGRRLVSPMKVGFVLAVLVMALVIPAGRSFAQDKSDKPAARSLYQRMGGYDVIAGVMDDIISQMRTDPAFERFGGGRSRDSAARARQLVVDLVCSLAGGPCTYIGRDMKTAHAGLKITDAEWDSMLKKFKVSLEKFKIAAPEQREFLAMIEGLRAAIVENPKEEKT